MGGWIRTVLVVGVVLLAGALLGSALSQWSWGRLGGGPSTGRPPPGRRVRVEVLNAGGVRGAARAATDLLRSRGFDVVLFGNAPTFGRDSSVVLDRVEGVEDARAVADALGIHNVRSVPDSNLYLDVSVWLGTDWDPERMARAEEGDVPRRPWWDLRRFLPRR
ncbi:MAG: LytR C-terminal domain-containing protein [Gemmatimonadota bacterium]